MLQDTITQLWVKVSGKRIDPEKDSWLTGPTGHKNIIGDEFIHLLNEQDDLVITRNRENSGILEHIDAFDLTQEEMQLLHPDIVHFYLHTTNYHFEIWSEWMGIFKPFGWMLTLFFSKRLQQLNLPTSSLATAKGLKSEIIQLKKDEQTIWTIWYRKLKSTNDVVFSGIYTTTHVPGFEKKLVKVIFPLPHGNASVFMTIQVQKDGSLLLSSNGKQSGENGFYFYLTDKQGKHWSKFVKALHEWLHIYVDDENVLRADHQFRFYGINFLNLHYKMTLIQ